VAGLVFVGVRPTWAQDVSFSATVDKTTVTVGQPLTLTLTLSGDASGLRVPTPELPEGVIIMAQGQATNVSIRAGAAERATRLTYVLVAQQAGTFRLGPFDVLHQKRKLTTDAIEITVTKPAAPPTTTPSGERFVL